MVPIIDSHCHIYPEKIAARAVAGIGDFYDIPMVLDGRVDTLLSSMASCGIDHAVVSSCATSPAQVVSINNFIADAVDKSEGKFTGLGTLHPESEDLEGDFEHLMALGLKGVKMHHDFQKFAIDDPKCMPIYELCAGRIPLLLHTGDNRYDYSNPDHMGPVLKAFPNLTVVGAHLGGWSIWDQAVKYLSKYENFVVDCSSALYAISPETAVEVMNAYGEDRIMFGTDFPMWGARGELKRVEKLGLPKQAQEKLFYYNAKRIFNIEEI